MVWYCYQLKFFDENGNLYWKFNKTQDDSTRFFVHLIDKLKIPMFRHRKQHLSITDTQITGIKLLNQHQKHTPNYNTYEEITINYEELPTDYTEKDVAERKAKAKKTRTAQESTHCLTIPIPNTNEELSLNDLLQNNTLYNELSSDDIHELKNTTNQNELPNDLEERTVQYEATRKDLTKRLYSTKDLNEKMTINKQIAAACPEEIKYNVQARYTVSNGDGQSIENMLVPISLNRFNNNNTKNCTPVVPSDEIILERTGHPKENVHLKLKSIVAHSGGLDNGHYLTYSSNPSDSENPWIKYNGTSIGKLPTLPKSVKSDGYLFFYEVTKTTQAV